MLAAGFPLVEIVVDEFGPGATRAPQDDGSVDPEDLPFQPGAGDMPGSDGSTSTDGSSSRPAESLFSPGQNARASGTGSALLDQILGAAQVTGHDVQVPDLPFDKLAPTNPLRAAILEWIAVTNSVVEPAVLEAELAKADAMPRQLQTDLAILVLAASEAALLQREALALLTPEQILWIHEHAHLADEMAAGVVDDETRKLASLAALVDTSKSIEASLMLLKAVEFTRGSLGPEGADRLRSLGEDLDGTAKAVLELLADQASRVTDQEKIRFAAELVALTNGVPLPQAAPAVAFPDAVAALMASSGQGADLGELRLALQRAELLPDDLEGALARLVLAQANAIHAASPAGLTPTSQAEALASILLTTADVLPVLEKHNLYWRNAPDALRVGQWNAAARLGWAAEHAALLASTGGDAANLVRAGGLLHDVGLLDAQVPQRSFRDAFIALAYEGALPLNESLLAEVDAAAARLDPATRDAAAVLMSAAAESSRLTKEAWAGLTPEERAFLLLDAQAADGLLAKPVLTEDERALLRRTAELQDRLDQEKILQAGLVAALGTEQARDILEGRGAYATAGAEMPRLLTTVWSKLRALLPVGTARAQGSGCTEQGLETVLVIQTDCPNDVVLRIKYRATPDSEAFNLDNTTYNARGGSSGRGTVVGTNGQPIIVIGGDPAGGSGIPSCVATKEGDDTACTAVAYSYYEANTDLLVITGEGSTAWVPDNGWRDTCNVVQERDAMNMPVQRVDTDTCKRTVEPQYGAPTIFLDLGGNDIYTGPVAVTTPTKPLPVSLHVDVGGNDKYQDPSTLYDAFSPLMRWIGYRNGHPSQASAVFGGVSILADVDGEDGYTAATRSQGFARYGVAILTDGAAKDVYIAQELSQAAASEGFNVGLAILADQGGDDRYFGKVGQGYGLGSLFLDTGGLDIYGSETSPRGVPIANLEIIPGGNLTTLHVRKDNRVWLDGPGDVSLGIGVDTEAVVINGGDSDDDGDADFVEIVAGSDPDNATDRAENGPDNRVESLAGDTDRDGYPDFIERALGSDADDPHVYPAGFPLGPQFTIPTMEGITVGEITGGSVEGFHRSDKVVDLRIPLQDAGTLDHACVGTMQLNMSGPSPYSFNALGSLTPGSNVLAGTTSTTSQGSCVFVSYTNNGDGTGNGTFSNPVQPTTGYQRFDFTIPQGILAVGDSVRTTYDIDYFLVVDLGGQDAFRNSAGGALLATAPGRGLDSGQNGLYDGAPDDFAYFAAPSYVLNVDASQADDAAAILAGDIVATGDGSPANDLYETPGKRRDFAHGSLFGVLIDTAGRDTYNAGNRSQGALGGLLLDLEGIDAHYAGDLSQGASRSWDTSAGGGAVDSQLAARSLPGLLLDLGESSDWYFAGNMSQGFAQGYLRGSTARNATTYGILLDASGADLYDTTGQLLGKPVRGTLAQGVGGSGGFGILADGTRSNSAASGMDTYTTAGLVSQGSVVSQTYGHDTSDRTYPGTGILLDAIGQDVYKYVLGSETIDRSAERQNRLTLHRGESATTQEGKRYSAYVDVSVHLDADASTPESLASTLFGTDSIHDLGGNAERPNGEAGFLVHLPAASFVIGSESPSVYTQDYAFLVDLGASDDEGKGANTYAGKTGGFIPAALVRGDQQDTSALSQASTAIGSEAAALNLYPVSLHLDAGAATSAYSSNTSLNHGAGFFSVGVSVDLGGPDSFNVSGAPLPAINNSWMRVPPTLEGSIGATEWNNTTQHNITLVDSYDPRFNATWKMRVANDNHSIYFAINASTPVTDDADRRGTLFVIDLDPGRNLEGWSEERGTTGLDRIEIEYTGGGACVHRDGHVGRTDPTLRLDIAEADEGGKDDVTVGCKVADGAFTLEIAKPIRAKGDPFDIQYDWHPDLGLLGDTKIGIRVEMREPYMQSNLAWPPATTDVDGNLTFSKGALPSDLRDEMRPWASTVLANQGEPAAARANLLTPIMGQGVGIAGVGILALLGTTDSSAVLAGSDYSQGYADFGGLAALLDAAGSDRYTAGEWSQGAGKNLGMGIFVDADGNDVYTSQGFSNGAGVRFGGGLFLDLGGSDDYHLLPTAGAASPIETPAQGILEDNNQPTPQPPQGADRDVNLGGGIRPPGNDRVWTNGTGLGADLKLTLYLRETLATVTDALYDGQPTQLRVVKTVPETGECSDDEADQESGAYVVTGKVCLRATVTLDDAIAGPTLTPTSPLDAAVSIEGVDFLVNGRLVHTERATTEASTLTFDHKISLDDLNDGISNFAAIAAVRVEQQGRGALVVYDKLDDVDPARARVYIDNPTTVHVDLAPDLLGEPSAQFSPQATLPNARDLDIHWNVSHDAAEDEFELIQGWAAPSHMRNIPCDRSAPNGTLVTRLCNAVPFYFRSGGSVISNEPGDGQASPGKIEFVTHGAVAAQGKLPAFTATPMAISKTHGMRLVIPDHTPIALPVNGKQTYTTHVRVWLETESGATFPSEGEPLYVVDDLFETELTTETGPTLDELFRAGGLGDAYALEHAFLSSLLDLCDPSKQECDNVLRATPGVAQSNICSLHERRNFELVAPNLRTVVDTICPAFHNQAGAGFAACGTTSPYNVGRATEGTLALCSSNTPINLANKTADAANCGYAPLGNVPDQSAAPAFEDTGPSGNTTGCEAGTGEQDVYGSLDATMDSLAPGERDGTNFRTFELTPTSGGLLPETDEAILIPEDMKLVVEVRVFSTAIGDSPASFEGIYEGIYGPIADALCTAVCGVGPYEPDRSLGKDVLTQVNGTRSTPRGIDSTVGSPIPVSFYTVETGTPAQQPRLEILMPTEPSTTAELRVETPGGSVQRVVRPEGLVEGDVPCVTRVTDPATTHCDAGRATERVDTFDGLSASGAFLDDGIYRVRARAHDTGGALREAEDLFRLDRTAPKSAIDTPDYVGSGTLENGKIRVRWDTVFEFGSGVHDVALYRTTPGSDPTRIESWSLVGVFPDAVRSTDEARSSGIDTYHFITVARDRVGNVEGAPMRDDAAEAFAAGLKAKVDARKWRQITVDVEDPVLTYAAQGMAPRHTISFQGSRLDFVKAGEPVAFRVCAQDGIGIQQVYTVFDHVPNETAEPISAPLAMRDVGACSTGGRLYEYSGWHTLNTNKTAFPDGVWSIGFQAYDRAANRVQIGFTNVILDGKPPEVHLEDVEYPAGQSAARLGTEIKLRLLAQDRPNFGVDEENIFLDISALNATAEESGDLVPARLVRGFREVKFTVDRLDLASGVYEVPAYVPDLAGNLNTTAKFLVQVDLTEFTIDAASVRITNVTHNTFTVEWTTSEPTTSLVKHDTKPSTGLRTPFNATLTREHAVVVQGAPASALVYVRAVSSSAGGLVVESDLLEVTTASALRLDADTPRLGDAVSGLVPVRFAGGLLDSLEPVTYTLEVRARHDAPWDFVTTLTEAGSEHVLHFNSSRYLDGTEYSLRLTAQAGNDRKEAILGPFLSDNTPPAVSLVSPLEATNDTTPLVLADIRDALSGFNGTPATLLLDGEPVNGTLVVEPQGDGFRVRHDVAAPLRQGAHTFELQVRDQAGNLVVATRKVVIDGEAPLATVNPFAYAPGPAAAKFGGTVTLNLTLKDESGVSLVRANTSALSLTFPETTLQKLAGTDLWVGTVPVTVTDAEALVRVPVEVIDLAGNTRRLTVEVPVDNVAPILTGIRLGEAGHRGINLTAVDASEPVILVGSATAPDAPAASAATDALAVDAKLAFTGLLPSRSYAYALKALDRAGNAAEFTGRFATLDDQLAPSAIADFQVVDLLNGTLRLTWSPASDDVEVAFYRVYRSEDGVTFRPIAEVRGLAYDDHNLPLEKAYHYHVVAVDHGGNEGEALPSFRAAASAVPTLTVGSVSPTLGTPATTFTYTVTYRSAGGIEPAYVRVYVDDTPQSMTPLPGGNALDGIEYVYETRLAPHKRDEPHTYSFEASDGRYTVRSPGQEAAARGPLVSGDALGAEDAGGLAAFAQKVPGGGFALSSLAVLIALVAIALVVRKKKEGSK